MKRWDLGLECKPDFTKCLERIYAWYEGELIDRAPVRFTAHNTFISEKVSKREWYDLRSKWFDVEFQVESYMESLRSQNFFAETFPVYWPNLGPNVYAAFMGAPLVFDEYTSWADPCLENLNDAGDLRVDPDNIYFRKIEELIQYALSICQGKFMVGYTDLHPGMDCLAALRDTQRLLVDLYDDPESVKSAVDIINNDFQMVYDHFDTILKNSFQLSVTWMGIPSYGKMHIPSCDFASMISTRHFNELCLPVLYNEVKSMDHNIFHLDGKGVARHIDSIISIPEIDAFQWVQGVGDDRPIMQWIALIKKIRDAGKSIVLDIELNELEDLIQNIRPEGIFLCLPANDRYSQLEILKRIEKW